MILNDLINAVEDFQMMYVKVCDFESQSFKKHSVNRSSSLLGCKVISFWATKSNGKNTLAINVDCKDLNDIRNFFKRY